MPMCMVETIFLAATIFQDANFIFCLKHMLNLVKKMVFKAKKLKTNIVKKHI